MAATEDLERTSWIARLGMSKLAWRTVMPGIDRSRLDKIDEAVELRGPGAIPELITFVRDEREDDDTRYWAMRYLLMFQWDSKISPNELLSCLGAVARSNPDKDYYPPRRDAMTALARVRGERGTDPHATDILTTIAADERGPLCLRRDALQVLGASDVIDALSPMKVDNVLEALLRGLLFLPRDNANVARFVVQGIRKIEQVPWQDKAKRLVHLLEGVTLSRGEIDTAAQIEAITPLEGEHPRFINQLANLFIESAARGGDQRMTELFADLLIEAAGGDPLRAGYQINSYERAHKMPEGSLRALRVAVGGEEALKLVSGILRADLKQYFQEPIFKLNKVTMEMWEKIISRAQWGFVVRLVMSAIVFVIGAYLVFASSFQMIFRDTSNIYGQGIAFAAGLASMFLVIYSGPLKDIRQSVTDLGTANAAFIGYIHRVLETSHTFSFFYTKETVDFDRLQRSSDIIKDAMNSTVDVLDRVAKDSSEGVFSRLLSLARRRTRGAASPRSN